MSAEIPSRTELSNDDLWVFGYGSLMWRPGFDFVAQVPARLIGEHRALCVYSFDHRGTPEKPGLVLGLDRGGACRGIAFRVAAKRRNDTVDYLRGREQTTHVYREVTRSVWLENEARQRVSALAYVVDRGHVQYAGRLSLAEQLRYVRQGHGRSGNNRDYVLSTVKSIETQGFRDSQLHRLALMLHDEASMHR
jgi:glutathione-specific gamma-glutamylcyclotransferase